MAESKTKKTKKEALIPTRKSVHVVFFSCPNCGDEIDDIKLCPECGEPMKVIDVVEKFGDDAERFLSRIQKRTEKSNAINKEEDDEEDYVGIDKEEPNIILMGDDDFEPNDGGIDPVSEVDDESLDVIFPDDDDSPRKDPVAIDDDDLTKALDQLDSEDSEDVSAEDFGFDDGEIPEL